MRSLIYYVFVAIGNLQQVLNLVWMYPYFLLGLELLGILGYCQCQYVKLLLKSIIQWQIWKEYVKKVKKVCCLFLLFWSQTIYYDHSSIFYVPWISHHLIQIVWNDQMANLYQLQNSHKNQNDESWKQKANHLFQIL